MPSTAAVPDSPAPIFARPRGPAGSGTFWKCHIGRRLHLARERAGGRDASNRPVLTRESLARQADMPAHRLWEIEMGVLPVDGAELARLAGALNVHPGSLFDDIPLEHWVMTTRGTPAWMLAATIGGMTPRDRDLLEAIVIRLDGRRPPRPPEQPEGPPCNP